MNKYILTVFGLYLMLCLPLAAKATPVEAVISDDRIKMDAGFNGTHIFFVGARNDAGDIVVVVRGPQKTYQVRRKEEVAWMWVNRERVKFHDVPSFYAIATTKPLSDIEQTLLFSKLGIGYDTLLSKYATPRRAVDPAPFAEALLNYQYDRGVYTKLPAMLEDGERLLKTSFAFPATIPTGSYTAEIYLLSDGEIIGMQSNPITVVKTGIEAFLYESAHRHSFFYGIGAIFMALSMGWIGGRLFSKGA